MLLIIKLNLSQKFWKKNYQAINLKFFKYQII